MSTLGGFAHTTPISHIAHGTIPPGARSRAALPTTGGEPVSGRFVRSVCTAAVMAVGAALALPAQPVAAAPAAPPGQTVSALLNRLQTLYRKAEEATETYNATEEKLKKQRTEVDRLGEDLATARIALNA
ncbi:hypothetical protein GCM10020000_26000 [Streptomyces olivoverticillatus]